jgi:hypothetical protein
MPTPTTGQASSSHRAVRSKASRCPHPGLMYKTYTYQYFEIFIYNLLEFMAPGPDHPGSRTGLRFVPQQVAPAHAVRPQQLVHTSGVFSLVQNGCRVPTRKNRATDLIACSDKGTPTWTRY